MIHLNVFISMHIYIIIYIYIYMLGMHIFSITCTILSTILTQHVFMLISMYNF